MFSFLVTRQTGQLSAFHNLNSPCFFDIGPTLLQNPTISYMKEALGSTLTPSGELHIQNDVEMMAAGPSVVPKAEDNELQEDAEMEDLFGNDEALEAKEEDDAMNRLG
jgi:hypothetical protein